MFTLQLTLDVRVGTLLDIYPPLVRVNFLINSKDSPRVTVCIWTSERGARTVSDLCCLIDTWPLGLNLPSFFLWVPVNILWGFLFASGLVWRAGIFLRILVACSCVCCTLKHYCILLYIVSYFNVLYCILL